MAGEKWRHGLALGCLGKGKSIWNRVSLVNTSRPQECESLLGHSLNVIAQPTHDLILSWLQSMDVRGREREGWRSAL